MWRDFQKFVCSWVFFLQVGYEFSFESELVGTMTANTIALLRYQKKLVIKSDSTYVVGIISSRSAIILCNYHNRWLHVLHLMRSKQICVSQSIVRETKRQIVLLLRPKKTFRGDLFPKDFILPLVSKGFSSLFFFFLNSCEFSLLKQCILSRPKSRVNSRRRLFLIIHNLNFCQKSCE